MERKCPSCGAVCTENTLYCEYCGTKLITDDKTYLKIKYFEDKKKAQEQEKAERKAREEQEANEKPMRTLAICALIFSFFFSIVGLILGIMGLKKIKEKNKYRTWCVAAIVISILMMILTVIAWLTPDEETEETAIVIINHFI